MDTKWRPDLAGHGGPKYRALAEAIRADLRSGRLRPGSRLPAVRDLAWELKVTPGTVARAYQIAAESGLLDATVGRGTFVRSAPAVEAPVPPRKLLLQEDLPGLVDLLVSRAVDVGQSAEIGEIAAEVARSGIDFTRYAVEGTDLTACRRAASDWLSAHGIGGAAGDLVLTEGAQHATFAALQFALSGREPAVAMPALAYPGFRRGIRAARARVVPVETDGEGILPEALEEAIGRHGVQAVIVSPEAHNPTTEAMGTGRREAVAEVVARHGIAVVEDDVYGLALGTRLPGFASLLPERTWVAASFSKSVAAGLRLGFLRVPPGTGVCAPQVLRGVGQATSLLLAGLVERLIRTGAADRIRAAVLEETRARLGLVRGILGNRPVRSRPDLNFLWLPLPAGWSTGAFVAAAERAGVLVAGADIFAAPDRTAPQGIRLSLAGARDRASLGAAVAEVAAILDAPPPVLVA